MKYTTFGQMRSLENRTVWAYRFCSDRTNKNYQEPVYGKIIWDSVFGDIFVPFNKDSKTLNYDGKAEVHTRNYADTKEEAIDGFREMLHTEANKHIKKLYELMDIEEKFVMTHVLNTEADKEGVN